MNRQPDLRAVRFPSLGVVGLVALPLLLRAQVAPDAPDLQKLETMVVTGSNIPSTETAAEAGPVPLMVFDRKAIDQTGIQTLTELLQKSAVSNGGAVPRSNNATSGIPSASSISLHGLGPEATLILVNGHRVASYPLGDGDQGTLAFVDLGTIPLAAVERVEVLKDGASAIYGADAIGGVVNVKLRTQTDGTSLDVRYANTTNKDASEFSAGLATGFSAGNLDLSVALNYAQRNAIFNKDRSYSATPPLPSSSSSPINAQITLAAYDEALGLPAGTLPPGVLRSPFFASPGITPGAAGGNTQSINGNLVAGSTNFGLTPAGQYIYTPRPSSRFNPNQYSATVPQTERRGASLAGAYRLGRQPNLDLYFDAIFQDNYTRNEAAPTATGPFSTPEGGLVIPARTTNPLPLPDGRARAAVAGAYNPYNPFNLDLAGVSNYRLVEFGNRIMRGTDEAALGTLGLRSTNLPDHWSFDVGVRYSWIGNWTDNTMVSISRFNQIANQADPIFNPSSPTYIGTTIAYNPFGYYGNPIPANQATVDYATVRVRDHSTSDLLNGFLTVNRPELWLLPAGYIGLAAGLDYRREGVAQSPDPRSTAGDVLSTSATPSTNSARDVFAVYAEARVPVFAPAQKIPGLHALQFDLAGRAESFLTSHQTRFVPKLGLRWQPAGDDWVVRASYGTGIRQPSLFELYNTTTYALGNYIDPRDGSEIDGIPTEIRGNPALHAEITTSVTAGTVWSHRVGRVAMTLAADAWRVVRDGTVTADAQNTVDRFFGAAPGGVLPGEAVTVDADGNITRVISPYVNAGRTTATGIDFMASGVLRTTSLGQFDLTATASRLLSMKRSILPGQAAVEWVNQATDESSSDGYLRWKGQTGVSWAQRGWTVSVDANFTDGFQDVDLNGDSYQLASTLVWDAQVTYTWNGDRWHWLKRTKVTVGANNIFDKDPPRAYGGGGSAIGYPGYIYSAEGRIIYVSLDKKF